MLEAKFNKFTYLQMKLKENSKTTHTGIQLETPVYSKKKHEEIYTLIFFFFPDWTRY